MKKSDREHWLNLPKEEVFRREPDFEPGEWPKLHREVLKTYYGDFPLLPIEFLKENPAAIEDGFEHPIEHHFLSSGTTARDRSRSSFTAQGMRDYRDFSVHSFKAMLETFFRGRPAPGISMIPPVSEWPTSSLAQMVAWLGEVYPLSYWKDDLPAPQEPVWLFATGFHIVAFADAGGYFPLPPGSIVIETGGTKGKTRSVTRDETYELIEKCFRVDKNHIVSEYGMCELASQAYDFVDHPNGRILELKDRWFRFPAWAQTRVLDAHQKVAKHGNGSLVIDDRARSDLKTPFRTEDRVELKANGSFQLQGRVAFSPLKGCSLLAEDILKAREERREEPVPVNGHYHPLDREELRLRAKTLFELSAHMLKDPAFHALVKKSLGLEKPAQWWMEDLKASLPPTIEAWIEAAEATRNQSPSWLMIPPRTHDFALMHPLFLAALMKLTVVVRETRETELLRYWQELFRGFWSFSTVSSDWRLEEGTVLPAQSVLVFGSDDTIEALRAATSHPVHGFGTWITLSVIHISSWDKEAWVKDAFSLRQEGCMSSRLLVVWDEETPKDLKPKAVSIGELSSGEQLHLAHSELDLALQGYKVFPRHDKNEMVLGHKAVKADEEINEFLSARPLTLPILRASRNDVTKLLSEIETNPSLKLLTLDDASKALLRGNETTLTRPLGRANEAPWTGWHGKEPLFFPRD